MDDLQLSIGKLILGDQIVLTVELTSIWEIGERPAGKGLERLISHDCPAYRQVCYFLHSRKKVRPFKYKLILEKSLISRNNVISTGNLPDGMYYLHLISKTGVRREILVIDRNASVNK